MRFSDYLDSEIDLLIGNVDDYGDAKYLRLDQNVPDGYVYDLQTELRTMGFTDVGTADGAFGEKTKKAVRQFQRKAKLPISGTVDHVTKNEIRTWLSHGYTKNSPPPTETPVTPATENGITLITPRVPHFSQGDSRWGVADAWKQVNHPKKGLRHHERRNDPQVFWAKRHTRNP